ncbi:hypothetical protein [Corallococcus sp. CA053C]|uniref:hypothetical protein n=1 Tax=Corallococcus sp. CA053C TaxID=2316732 RepID=UPI0011C44978|nr:hypothetical protein [Corallococcus sp. CA053C]
MTNPNAQDASEQPNTATCSREVGRYHVTLSSDTAQALAGVRAVTEEAEKASAALGKVEQGLVTPADLAALITAATGALQELRGADRQGALTDLAPIDTVAAGLAKLVAQARIIACHE